MGWFRPVKTKFEGQIWLRQVEYGHTGLRMVQIEYCSDKVEHGFDANTMAKYWSSKGRENVPVVERFKVKWKLKYYDKFDLHLILNIPNDRWPLFYNIINYFVDVPLLSLLCIDVIFLLINLHFEDMWHWIESVKFCVASRWFSFKMWYLF